jgi:excinuclease ABC subunit C
MTLIFMTGRREIAGPRGRALLLPAAPGVYRFSDAAGRVLYLGRAVSLRRRAVSYWGDLRDRGHLAPMVARIARLEAVVCDSAHEAAWLERNLLEASLPPWNRAPRGGQEKEVWIRLSSSARTPGIEVVHRPSSSPGARHFGPYLGGLQVRRAVSGLSRVLPLGYAGRQPSGTRHEMARALGVSGVERAELERTVTAVLDRDPAAVAAVSERLRARRDEAAAALAFEFATRLQAELAGLAWVTAEQKVTSATAGDADVCGWADGLLISFAVRGGRLSGWTQRACGAESARPHVDGTPPEWAAFAHRNADLAVRLCAGGNEHDELLLLRGNSWGQSVKRVVSLFPPRRRLDHDGTMCTVWQLTSAAWRRVGLRVAGAGGRGGGGRAGRLQQQWQQRLERQRPGRLLLRQDQPGEFDQGSDQPECQQWGQRPEVAGVQDPERRDHARQLGQGRLPEPDQRDHHIGEHAQELGLVAVVEPLRRPDRHRHQGRGQRGELGRELHERERLQVQLICSAGRHDA